MAVAKCNDLETITLNCLFSSTITQNLKIINHVQNLKYVLSYAFRTNSWCSNDVILMHNWFLHETLLYLHIKLFEVMHTPILCIILDAKGMKNGKQKPI